MISFWKRVWLFAHNKMKDDHLYKYGFDTKCPNCETWASENDGIQNG